MSEEKKQSKTKKELNALKKEVEELNEKIKELTEEELEQVVGGLCPQEIEAFQLSSKESLTCTLH